MVSARPSRSRRVFGILLLLASVSALSQLAQAGNDPETATDNWSVLGPGTPHADGDNVDGGGQKAAENVDQGKGETRDDSSKDPAAAGATSVPGDAASAASKDGEPSGRKHDGGTEATEPGADPEPEHKGESTSGNTEPASNASKDRAGEGVAEAGSASAAGQDEAKGHITVEVNDSSRNATDVATPGKEGTRGESSDGDPVLSNTNSTSAATNATQEPVGEPNAADAATLSALNVTFDTSQKHVDAYLQGKPVGNFETCGRVSGSDPSSVGEGCHAAGEYEDRNTVQMKFDKTALNASLLDEMLKNFQIVRFAPRVSARGGRSDPHIVSGWKVEKDSAAVTMVVKYACRPRPENDPVVNASSLITLHVPISVSGALELSWVKRCGSGRFGHLDFGYLNHEKKSVLFHHDGTHGETKEVGLEVAPHELSTVLTLRLNGGVQALDFQAPYVTSSRPDFVKFSVRGALNQGTLSLTPSEPAEISIMYECKAAVSSDFDVSIGIPPWSNLTAAWTKDCGGRIAKSLLIGTGISKAFDVLHDGELSSSYNVSGVIGSPYAMRPQGLQRIDSSTHHSVFYVSNVDETSAINIQSVTITTDQSSILSVLVEKPSIQPLVGSGYITKDGGLLKRKESKRLSLQYYCRATGSVTVLVTLSTLLYQNVEFGFVKDCVEGRVFHQSALTAGSLMTALFLAAVLTAAMACCYVVQKRKREDALLRAAIGKQVKRKGAYTLVDDTGLDF